MGCGILENRSDTGCTGWALIGMDLTWFDCCGQGAGGGAQHREEFLPRMGCSRTAVFLSFPLEFVGEDAT